MNKTNERAKRFYERNKQRLTAERQHRKTYSQFINELSNDLIRHDAEFLADYVQKVKPTQSYDVVAATYKKMCTDLELNEQRINALSKPAFYKALTERLKLEA